MSRRFHGRSCPSFKALVVVCINQLLAPLPSCNLNQDHSHVRDDLCCWWFYAVHIFWQYIIDFLLVFVWILCLCIDHWHVGMCVCVCLYFVCLCVFVSICVFVSVSVSHCNCAMQVCVAIGPPVSQGAIDESLESRTTLFRRFSLESFYMFIFVYL